MIATFLRAEIDSERYGAKLAGLLARDHREAEILRSPDLVDLEANAYRRMLLDEHRDYGRRDELFGGFPTHVEWFRARLDRDELLDLLYINWDWWLEISGGTRRPRNAARLIRSGAIPGVGDEGNDVIARATTSEHPPPELIVATTQSLSPLVVLEGHVRLTAYALYPELLAPEHEVLVGVSDRMAEWSNF
jgi:hypothetical protein